MHAPSILFQTIQDITYRVRMLCLFCTPVHALTIQLDPVGYELAIRHWAEQQLFSALIYLHHINGVTTDHRQMSLCDVGHTFLMLTLLKKFLSG